MHAGIARAVDEVHWSCAGQSLFQHRQGRRDTDAAADQHQGLVARFEGELASRREQLQHGTFGHGMQRVRGDAAGLALDADAVFAAIAGGGQRVVAAHLLAVDLQAQADVLAGQKVHQRAAIFRLQVKGGDLCAFDGLARNAKTPRPPPASIRLGLGLVEILLLTDKDVGELLIGGAPGVDHGVGSDLVAEHFADRPQQAGANQRVMLGQYLQRDMLVDDLSDQRAEGVEAVDVFGIHQHAVGQCTRLFTAGLVGLIEQRAHFGMFTEQ